MVFWDFYILRYFICRRIVRQSCSIVENLVVNYHLVVSYAQQGHIGINSNHWYVIIIPIHIMLFLHFLMQNFEWFFKLLFIITIWNKKQTNWPYKQYYVKTSRYFYRKLYHLFFQVQEKLETCRNSNLTNCRRSSFGDDINVTFIS